MVYPLWQIVFSSLQVELLVPHTPCLSCVGAFTQLRRWCPRLHVAVAYQERKSGRRKDEVMAGGFNFASPWGCWRLRIGWWLFVWISCSMVVVNGWSLSVWFWVLLILTVCNQCAFFQAKPCKDGSPYKGGTDFCCSFCSCGLWRRSPNDQDRRLVAPKA